jgi:hypothetical protein
MPGMWRDVCWNLAQTLTASMRSIHGIAGVAVSDNGLLGKDELRPSLSWATGPRRRPGACAWNSAGSANRVR